jgi:hypothetical protein
MFIILIDCLHEFTFISSINFLISKQIKNIKYEYKLRMNKELRNNKQYK